MEKPHLFFDFDGVKFDTVPHEVKYLNARYGIDIKVSEFRGKSEIVDKIINSYLPKTDQLDRLEIWKDLGQNYSASIKWHQDVLPMNGMLKVIKSLREKYTIWTVTSRQSDGKYVIQYLLDKYVPGCINGIHCVYTFNDNNLSAVFKKDFIRSIKGEKIAFFDDSPSEIEAVKDLIPSYLFDPFYLYDDIDGADHLHSWEQIGKIFL
jgi:hypothetical protein